MFFQSAGGRFNVRTVKSQFRDGVTAVVIEFDALSQEVVGSMKYLVYSVEDFFHLEDQLPDEVGPVLDKFKELVEGDKRPAKEIVLGLIDIPMSKPLATSSAGDFFGFGQKIVAELRLKNYRPPKFERPKLASAEQFRVGDVIVENSRKNSPLCYDGIVGSGGRVLYYPGHHGIYGQSHGSWHDYSGHRLATERERQKLLLSMANKPVVQACPRDFFNQYMLPQFVEAQIAAKANAVAV